MAVENFCDNPPDECNNVNITTRKAPAATIARGEYMSETIVGSPYFKLRKISKRRKLGKRKARRRTPEREREMELEPWRTFEWYAITAALTGLNSPFSFVKMQSMMELLVSSSL